MPAAVWRGGSKRRGVSVGVCAGLFFGVLAWLDSGMLIAGLIVFVVLGVASGVLMGRRMSRYWPSASELSGAQRVAVVAAARRGATVGDAALAPAVEGYSRALHAAADHGRSWRWLFVSVLIVALATTLWDALYGSWGNAVASAVYLALVILELFWWPRRLAELLANADRAATTTRQLDNQTDG